jgi:hypothetical protein
MGTHGRGSEGRNWRMEWVASTLHTTSEHGVSIITTADAQTSAASSRLNWRPRRLKWTRPFRRKTKSDFCACAITFQTQSTIIIPVCILFPETNFVFLCRYLGHLNRLFLQGFTSILYYFPIHVLGRLISLRMIKLQTTWTLLLGYFTSIFIVAPCNLKIH